MPPSPPCATVILQKNTSENQFPYVPMKRWTHERVMIKDLRSQFRNSNAVCVKNNQRKHITGTFKCAQQVRGCQGRGLIANELSLICRMREGNGKVQRWCFS